MTPYADTTYADTYFSESFFVDGWEDTHPSRKERALKEATKRIDRLRFVGNKTSTTQENEFPRDGETEVPENIKKATCELAIRFIQGIHPDLEIDGAKIISSGVSSARMTEDADLTPVWILHGIPSQAAWVLMMPYINNNLELRVVR